MNERIRSPQVRLVGADGEQIGVVASTEALRMARELDLDLVEVAPQANPPVCRIMDYGKFKYERDIRQKEARKKQSRTELKEIKFRPKIDAHDYGTKKGHVERFLRGGHKVKVTIMFRGREMTHTDLGRKILDRLVGDLGEMVTVESMPKQEGRNMIMVISPNKRYMEQLARAKALDPQVESEQAQEPEPEPEPQPEAAAQPETAPEPEPVATATADLDEG
ncbi:MAG TPA: translation initiation factor IF-3 [Actinomycetota bacterium]|nr:translation initiation factor IF-3 [Actinomycetota bacterium]